jgi:hypothetical protein
MEARNEKGAIGGEINFCGRQRDTLPLTASGKVQKHLLRAMLVAKATQPHDGGSALRE